MALQCVLCTMGLSFGIVDDGFVFGFPFTAIEPSERSIPFSFSWGWLIVDLLVISSLIIWFKFLKTHFFKGELPLAAFLCFCWLNLVLVGAGLFFKVVKHDEKPYSVFDVYCTATLFAILFYLPLHSHFSKEINHFLSRRCFNLNNWTRKRP